MKMMSSHSGHELVTVSRDGKLCCWTMDNSLDKPTASFDLKAPTVLNPNKQFVTALDFAFSSNQHSNFVIGGEGNIIYVGGWHADGEIKRVIEEENIG